MILCLCPNPSLDKFIWMEDIIPGKANRIVKQRFYPGGKGVHVALGIAELGEECAILGFWGGDTGKLIRQACVEKGITCYGPLIDEANRSCFTVRSGGDWDGTELLEPGPFIDQEKMDLFRSEFIRLLGAASVICMSGSWPPSDVEAGYEEFIIAAKEKNVMSFADCSGKYLEKLVAANPYCIHINHHEGFELYKDPSPLNITAAVLKNCTLAAVTCGAGGLYLADNNRFIIHASCELEKIISAVGCGDSLMAGLVTAYHRKLNLLDTAILATACGSANCLREDLGMFYQKDVQELSAKVKATLISYGDPEFLPNASASTQNF